MWWALPAVALVQLSHIATMPFFERQFFFSEGSLWKVISALTVLSLLAVFKVVKLGSRDVAMLLGGFVINWMLLSPCWFYTTEGPNWSPRPHAGLVVTITVCCTILIPGWNVLSAAHLGRKWWLALPFALVQCWMAFVSLFMVAGFVAGTWL